MKAAAVFALLAVIGDAAAQSLAPSPTESIGCEPHDDHWHCEGPRGSGDATVAATDIPITTTSGPAAVTTTSATGDHEGHTDEASSGSLAPSPTESVGCEPHGDHWHCDGPAATAATTGTGTTATTATRTTLSTSTTNSTTEPTTSSTPVPANGASRSVGTGFVIPVVGFIALLAIL